MSNNLNLNLNKNIISDNINIYSLIYAHLLVYLILIYYIIIPIINRIGINDKAFDLFKSYYLDNKFKSLLIDFFVGYLLLDMANKLPSNIPIYIRRIIIIVIYDLLLSVYLNRTPSNSGTIGFLKNWTGSVGWFAILWDLILFNILGLAMDKINNIKFIKSDPYKTGIIGLMSFILLHI